MRALPVAVALALSFNAVSAHAQAAPHRWIEATASAGASFTGPGSRYQESAQGALTLGAGVGVTHRVGVEVSAALNVGWGYPILSCDLSPSPCPVRFHVRSLSGDVVLNLGPQTHPSRLRLLVGAGSYRLASTEPSPPIASQGSVGLDLGLVRRLGSGQHGDLNLVGRGIVIPSGAGRLGMLQLGLGGRIF